MALSTRSPRAPAHVAHRPHGTHRAHRAHLTGRAALALFAALAALAVLLAATPARAEAGDELTVSVLTFGPGDHPFFKFGHNAIRVQDGLRRRDVVYNYGTFTFDSPALIPTFIKGRLLYWLSKQTMASTIAGYRAENRTIDEQVLDLTPAERRAMLEFLEWNVRPENRHYKYDYYLDNCSTRVRDVVDRAVGGRLREASRAPGSMTWRQHTRRLTHDSVFYYALHVVLGGRVDQPIDQWAEMFLPAKLAEGLGRATVSRDGAERPLVREERRVLDASRPPMPTAPPRREPLMALLGLLSGAGLFALGRKARVSAGARVGLGVLLVPFGLVLGFLGSFFSFVWAFTDHVVSHKNENILTCAPFAFAFVVLGVGVARGKGLVAASNVATAGAVTSALGLALKVLPWFRQDSWEFLLLLLPTWAGLALGLRALASATPTPGDKRKKKKKKRTTPAPSPAATRASDEAEPDEPGHDEAEPDEPGRDEPGRDEAEHGEPGSDEPKRPEPREPEPSDDEAGQGATSDDESAPRQGDGEHDGRARKGDSDE